MASGHTIRPATTDDVEAIRSVARASWEAAYSDFLAAEAIDEMLDEWYSVDFLEDAIESDEMGLFVAERGDDVVGYISSEPPVEGEIGQVSSYVHPDHWREGVGTDLLDRAKDHLRENGATAMQDTVLADNEVGTAFYRKHFEKTGETTVDIGGESYPANVFTGDLG